MRTCTSISAAAVASPLLRQQRPGISWQRHSFRQLRCSAMTTRQQGLAGGDGDSRMRQNTGSEVFQPSVWGDFFVGYSNPAASSEQQIQMQEQVDKLREEVAKMIASSTTISSKLHLIDVLERLCLDHLFEQDISAAVAHMEAADFSDWDLGTVAQWFCLLRKHRYRVSPDVFARFKDEEGGFLVDSPKDLLDLYNAAHMRTHGETILEEAILFSQRRLETMIRNMEDSSLAREIKSALEIPLPRRVRIYELKYYISAYEQDATVHEKVVQLAKLNSNIMQLHHQHELDIVSRWWKDIDLGSKLPYVRDRLVECYLWILGVYYEPCYSRARIILTMNIAIVTILDDTYDSYATPDECELLTKCIESWDTKMAQDLPERVKYAWEKVFKSYETIENMLQPEEKYRMPYLRYFVKDLVKSYNTEVKMLQEGYIPKSVEEHLKISLITGGCPILACASFVGMNDIATDDCFVWVSGMPIMVRALSVILRFVDDLESYEREQLIPHVASTIDTYMKEHNVSMEVARGQILVLKEETWKDFNSDWLDPNNDVYPKQLLERIFNLTRTMDFMYHQGEHYTNGHGLKDLVHSLLLAEPFVVPN